MPSSVFEDALGWLDASEYPDLPSVFDSDLWSWSAGWGDDGSMAGDALCLGFVGYGLDILVERILVYSSNR